MGWMAFFLLVGKAGRAGDDARIGSADFDCAALAWAGASSVLDYPKECRPR